MTPEFEALIRVKVAKWKDSDHHYQDNHWSLLDYEALLAEIDALRAQIQLAREYAESIKAQAASRCSQHDTCDCLSAIRWREADALLKQLESSATT